MRQLISRVGVITLSLCLWGCGGASSPTSTPALPISIEGLDGATDVPVDSTFEYQFDSIVQETTVNDSSFFIVATPSQNIASPIKAAVDPVICNSANALSAGTDCSTPATSCILDPQDNLSYATRYSICLTTDIKAAIAGRTFDGFMATFTTVASSSASCTAPTCDTIHTLILAANSTGIRPGVAFTSITMPEFTCTGGTPTYSISDLPSWLSFDSTTRAISLNGVSAIPSDATSSYTVTYTATIDSTPTSVSCLLNDSDGDTMIDYKEYKYSKTPLLNSSFGAIDLNDVTDLIYRPAASGGTKLIPTWITVTTSGLNLADASDATADFDIDAGRTGGGTNAEEIAAGTNVFVVPTAGTFAAAVAYTVGGQPSDIALGDFDGDGDLDMAVADKNSDSIGGNNGTVSILPGNGNGTFGSRTSYSLDHPTGISAGDLDRDGDLDLAVSSNDSADMSIDYLVILLNNSGTFTASSETYYSIEDGSIGSNAVGDLDGDGDLDVVVANASADDDNIAVFLNDGDGTFASAVTYPMAVTTDPVDLALADFDSDGDLDVVVSNLTNDTTGTTVSVLLGNGDGTFQTKTDYSAGGNAPIGVTCGDYSGDGSIDIAVVGIGGTLAILLGNDNGTFQMGAMYSVTGVGIASADLDGDNDIDLVAADIGSNGISVLLGNGDGTFASKVSYGLTTGLTPFFLAAGDFDNDGDIDVAVPVQDSLTSGDADGTTVQVFLNQ